MVWVDAAPTGKKLAAALKRKSSADDVSKPKARRPRAGLLQCVSVWIIIVSAKI
jgi:hypothetical protein